MSERDVLDSLDDHAAAFGGAVAPVLNRQGLPLRLRAALEFAGHHVAIAVPRPVPGQGPVPPMPRRPRHVLATVGVDSDIVTLAARLCHATPLPLSEQVVPPDVGSALVLVHAGSVNLRDAAAGLSALARAGAPIGLVLVEDEVEARYAILKALLADRVSGTGRFALLAPHLPAARAAGAPQCLCDSDEARGTELFLSPQDVLILSGHATPIDANFGRSLIMCGRAGAEAVGGRGTAYPCSSGDGACFRQRLIGRKFDSREGLTSLMETRSALVILAGCNVAAIGRSWFGTSQGLAYQAQQSGALAAVATTSMMSRRIELDFLFLALLAEGQPVGAATDALNLIRSRRLRHVTALPPGVGPFVVLGNPELTVEGLRLQHVEAVPALVGPCVTVPLDGVEIAPLTGALVRVDLPGAPSGDLMIVDRPDGMFCVGVLYQPEVSDEGRCPSGSAAAGPDTRLYLWLGLAEGATRPRSLCFLPAEPQADAALRAMVEDCLRQIPFWTVFLAGYVRQMRETGQPPDLFRAVLSELADGAVDLSEMSNALRERPGAVRDRAQDRALQSVVLDSACVLGARLLGSMTEIACQFGTVQSHGWDTRLERCEAVGPFGACLCGSGDVWGQRYRMPGADDLVRVEYQCAACGPIGEDDGRRLLRASFLPRRAPAGSEILCRGVLDAPPDRFVLARFLPVLESWMKTGRMLGEIAELLAAPGESREWVLPLALPPGLQPGAYPLAILGVVNGAPTIIRQMLEIT